MLKSDIIEKVAEQSGLSKKASGEIVNTVFMAITDALGSGEKVSIDKFGTFVISERAARTCQNPQTLEKVDVPAKKVVKFKASSVVKETVAKL